MAIYDAEIVDITPFGEEWKTPYDGNSLYDTNIYSQLIRGYNHLNKEIGVNLPCGLNYKPNDYVSFTGLSAFPTASELAGVAETNVPQGQYINYCIKILKDLFTELTAFCNYSLVLNTYLSSATGYDSSSDRYWQIYDADYDSTSSNFQIRLKDIIEGYDEELFNPAANNNFYSNTPLIEPDAFLLKSNWGNIIKVLQDGHDMFTQKKSKAYTKRIGSFSVEYINNSSEYPFENFSYIQRTGETVSTTNGGTKTWVRLDTTSDDYMFPGNNAHNYCPTQKTQYTSEDILALPSWEVDIYASNIFGSGENRANGGFDGYNDNWAISGFYYGADNAHPINPETYFFTTYTYNTPVINPQGPCMANVVYERGYGYTWYEQLFLKNVGWYKLGGSRRKYKIKMAVSGMPTFNFPTGVDIKVVPTFKVTPDVAGRSIIVTGNDFKFYNNNQTSTMTVSAQLTLDAYLGQPAIPVPSSYTPRTIGARITFNGWQYYINGHALLDPYGRPRINFFVYSSPCGKLYIDNESLN
jgi:hypothetical protein